MCFPCGSYGKESAWNVGDLGFGPGEDPLEKGKATHSSLLAWRIPRTVQSRGSQRVGHVWATFTPDLSCSNLRNLDRDTEVGWSCYLNGSIHILWLPRALWRATHGDAAALRSGKWRRGRSLRFNDGACGREESSGWSSAGHRPLPLCGLPAGLSPLGAGQPSHCTPHPEDHSHPAPQRRAWPLTSESLGLSLSLTALSQFLHGPAPVTIPRPFPWNSSVSRRGMHALLQGIFPAQGSDGTQVSRIAGGFFTIWVTREALSVEKLIIHRQRNSVVGRPGFNLQSCFTFPKSFRK